MTLSRREFLKGGLAAFGGLAGGGFSAFAVPAGTRQQRAPKLVFGVLADTHFRCDHEWRRGVKSDKFFVAALEYFRSRNVDAVVHCGDMADRGLVEELQRHADAWYRVFPGDKAPDGHTVEKLFVTGNHDAQGWSKNMDWVKFVPDASEWPDKILKFDMARHWERIWGEKYEPVWRKTVKGHDFFGMNWIENAGGEGEAALMRLIDERAPSDNPFFFVTHDRTHGTFNKAIKNHPGAFGLWGHWHLSAANWNTVQMLNDSTPGVQCPACPAWWREDGKWMGGGDDGIARAPLEGKLQGGRWEQGLVVSIYDDRLAIERREFSEGGSLGADWVMPFARAEGAGHPFSKEELKKAIGAPQFRDGAKLEVSNSGPGGIAVKIPLADGNPDSRVYAYEIAVAGEEGSRKLFKAVYAAGCNMGTGREPNGGATTLEIAASELPPGKTLTVAARPLSSLGTNGRAIAKEVESA